MIRSSSEKAFQEKQEGDANDISMFSKEISGSSRQWSGFRNPRIVRVSRTFGGKDRHSKVRTIRGLRDRRIRLSVPTAIQLYDLQDRLGLSQPSKVIDWLLDASKLDIDKLPPLQMPPGNFSQFLQPMLFSHDQSNAPHHQSSLTPFFDTNSLLSTKQGININSNVDVEDQDQAIMMRKSKYWDPNASLKGKSKEVGRELSIAEKTKWMMKINEEENNQDVGIGAQNLFPIANNNHSSVQGLVLNNATMPYNSYHHWEPSNLSLSQLGNHGFSSQTDQDPHNIGSSTSTHVSLQPSPFALSSGSQLFFCPSTTPLPSSVFPHYLPPHMTSTSTPTESIVDPRHFQLLSSSAQHVLPNSLIPSFHSISSMMKPFPSNLNPKLLPLQSNSEHQANKDDTAGS